MQFSQNRARQVLTIVGVIAALAATSCVVPPPPPPPPTPESPTLTVSTVVPGLANPWDMGFTPDGSMLFTERSGNIKALVGTDVRLLAHPADVFVAGEGGMLGLAIDSQFATNRYVYTCFNSTSSGSPDVRVVRWTVDASVTALTDRTDIVTGIPVNSAGQAGRHSGCRPRFGPDGYLWVTTGDAATGTNPQDPNSLGGKVLRVDRTGAGAPGNPGAPFLPQIYNYGHRNGQGLAFRPSDGTPYDVEHGPNQDDEVNRLVAGGNYGWDPVPADLSPGYDESVPMTDLTKFPGAVTATWSSGFPTLATSGATFVTGTQWKSWDGALVIACLKGNRLQVVQMDAAGNVTGTEAGVTDQGRLRVPVQGPDGDLYVAVDANPGSILRVHPEPDPPAG